jgi:hypothetical protein
MQEAEVNGKLLVAGPDAPHTAACPDCETEVQKRRFRRMGGDVTYFYRHMLGQERDFPGCYRPT